MLQPWRRFEVVTRLSPVEVVKEIRPAFIAPEKVSEARAGWVGGVSIQGIDALRLQRRAPLPPLRLRVRFEEVEGGTRVVGEVALRPSFWFLLALVIAFAAWAVASAPYSHGMLFVWLFPLSVYVPSMHTLHVRGREAASIFTQLPPLEENPSEGVFR